MSDGVTAPADPEDARLAGLLLGTRLPSVSGGPIAYVTTSPTIDTTADEGE
ncbi:hypothetical protein P3T27_008129 [Kitasatospora sp. MAA19]|uniref:hypothetical protein n=1 Tax=Kitasatospora sp. MAA19 TaxID=3035090 RepID=UPI002474D0A6|nr:hypothetical protein [Kitasatospora sp. MAA19]MDH6711371.1 hypothetical protein [Kitasatospora sp. MAA19]